MKYPISQLEATESEMEALAQRINILSNRARAAHSVILSCYNQGGVGERTGAVALTISHQAKAVLDLGKITATAANAYMAAQDNVCLKVYAASGEVYTRPVDPPKEESTPKMSTWTKIWKTGAAALSIGTTTITMAATWALAGVTAGVGAPGAALVTLYSVNTIANKSTDIYNIWHGDEAKVGKINYMKDAMAEGGGNLAEMLGVDRDIGEMLGKGLYGIGDIASGVTSGRCVATIKGERLLTTAGDDFKNKLIEKYVPWVKWDKYRQSEMFNLKKVTLTSKPLSVFERLTRVGFVDTGLAALEELPEALADYSDVVRKFDANTIVEELESLDEKFENLKKMTKFLKDTKKLAESTEKSMGRLISAVPSTY